MDQATLQQVEPSTKLPSIECGNKPSTWKYHLLNLWYVLTASVAGMISGGVVLYFTAIIILIPLNGAESYPGENCGRAMAIGWLSILSGAFFGTVGGATFAVKNPICK